MSFDLDDQLERDGYYNDPTGQNSGMRTPEESDLSGGETDAYPTEWQVRDGFVKEEWRQLDTEHYQVRNPDNTMILTLEAWEAYNKGAVAFLIYLNTNGVAITPRTDLDG